ncbi:hypothetical protein [Nocardioides speluncae]|uniref:hypothetical protein n=1 Tax=Nocardioides speluncae TaxID=2670337 RepID=UPI000D6964C0|nr:hypothetical protein [Nocardioides speluncae]
MTSAKRLLREIDPLPNPQRQAALAKRARALVGSEDLPRLLAELAATDGYGRRLALQLAGIAGDREYVATALRSPDPDAAVRACALAVKVGVAESELIDALPVLPAAHRDAIYGAVRRRRATELADALLPEVRRRYGDHEAAALLVAVSSETVAELLPDLEHAVRNWYALGRQHPAVLIDYVEWEFRTQPATLWAQTWSRVGGAVAAATLAEPKRVFKLLETSVAYAPFPADLYRVAGVLARTDPARFLKLANDPRRLGAMPHGRAVMDALLDAPEDDLVGYARGLFEDGLLPAFLRRLPPARRPAVYAAVVGERDPGDRDLLAAVDVLPRSARAEEAARLLKFASVQDDPQSRLAMTARLDWAEAEPLLVTATRRATAEERAEAYPLLIGAAAATRSPNTFGGVVGFLTRLRNEQEPVRAPALEALADVAPWLYREEDMPTVVVLASDALAARDCSWRSQSAIRTWSERLLREGAAARRPSLTSTALALMELSGSSQGSLHFYGLYRSLPRGAEHEVYDALRDRIESDAARGRYDVTIALAQGLGRRAWDIPELQKHIDHARRAKDDHVVRSAIGLWLAPPDTRAERVAQVFDADRSTITIPAVASAIAWRRTDLLDPVFKKSLKGRFLERGVRFLPQFHGCFHGWMPRQVAAYVEHLAGLATEPKTMTWERAKAVRSLRGVPGSLPAIRAFVGDSEVAVAEAAIAALAHSEDPAAVLPELLRHADGDRARVAVYAATRCARFVSPENLAAALRPLLSSRKVTSKKEGIRLIAEHQAVGAEDRLHQLWTAANQHRDIRRAIVRAERWYLHDDAAWQVLMSAAADPELATAVLELTPYQVARERRGRYTRLVLDVSRSADIDTARRGLAVLPQWLPWNAKGVDALVDRVADLDHTAAWRPALTALVAGVGVVGKGAPVAEAARRLSEADDDSRDTEQRDRPASQRLQALVAEVAVAVSSARAMPAVGGELAEVLRSSHSKGAITALAAALAWDDVGALQEIAALADRPLLAGHAADEVAGSLRRVVSRLPAERTLDQARELAFGSDGSGAAQLALAVAAVAGAEAGWPPDWQELVRDLRRHEDPEVRDRALEVALAPE